MAKAKPMNRSRNQLATAYAPESFFTFEGGVGACISHSMPGEPASLLDSTRTNILERLEQFGVAWLDTGMRARDNKPDQALKAPVLAEQCVERTLLDDARQAFRLPGADKIYFSKPSNMGYTPAPLTFVCRHCDLFREYATLRDMSRDLANLQAQRCSSQRAPNGLCSWEQLDVIFVHWSGNWAPASPNLWDFRGEGAALNRTQCPSCGGNEFRLNRDSPKLGEWHFLCAKCNKRQGERWMQRDRNTLEMFQTKVGEGRIKGPTEVNMEAIPYRASNAYHIQSELFIDFKDDSGRLSGLLRLGAESQLGDFIARACGFAGAPPSDEDVEAACAGRPDCAEDLRMFRAANASIAKIRARMSKDDPAARVEWEELLQPALHSREQVLQRLRERQILLPKVSLPSSITATLPAPVRRRMFASRFDPYQLAIEHAMLKRTRLDVNETVGGKRRYVSFKQLDNDLAPDTQEETRALENAARERLEKLGIADMGLIREFELCRFSFGYSRMQAGPVLHDKRHMNMPVRLRLFPPVRDDGVMKNPIYVVQQANQAIYVRLDEQRVMAWLQALACQDMFTLSAGQCVGAGALSVATRMDRFLETLPRGESPPTYLYLYTLLHSYAHLVMRQVSEYSGLDLGSLGEYLFPADLAFVIYRNGTTMDLGNLSAMWRNSGRAMLGSLLDPRAAQCGTGSLCTTRGGSCPDCLMIPETSCIASNKLVSRAVLRSIGGRPNFDTRAGAIQGYLETLVPHQREQ
jgi:hypothetical protein